jgi:hypothetical protein
MPAPKSALAVKALLQPHFLAKAFISKFSLGSFEFRLALDALRRPWYGYGVYHAAWLAERLRIPRIVVLEFGVAMGDGLVELERMAQEVSKISSTQIQVVGFDTGIGMPQHSGYKDLPYVWRKGLYRMDVDAVRRRLQSAELVLGDVADTVPAFLSRLQGAAIGFVSVDVDYYSSTCGALQIFNGPDELYLPRVLSYFDDLVGDDTQMHCEDVGELLAIKEFNDAATKHHRIRPINGLLSKRPMASPWTPNMMVYHRYDHGRYGDYIGSGKLPEE